MYDKTHDTPYFNMNTDCDYIGKCFAILIIYCGGILVEIIDILNQFLCKIVYVRCIKPIVYKFLYEKILLGIIRKFKSVYDFLMVRIHCWQTTTSDNNPNNVEIATNGVNVIIGNEIECCVCCNEWNSKLRDDEKEKIKNMCLIYNDLLNELNNNNATKFTTAILLKCAHSICFVYAITILSTSISNSQIKYDHNSP